jgi:hypothetical protein
MIVKIELQLSKCTRWYNVMRKFDFRIEDRNTHVYQLKENLYVLKQAPRA